MNKNSIEEVSVYTTKITSDMHDWGKNQIDLETTTVVSNNGVGVRFKGYGDIGSEDGYGEPVWIENRDGVPHILIWADINQEEPTHVISLAGAAEALRQKQDAS